MARSSSGRPASNLARASAATRCWSMPLRFAACCVRATGTTASGSRLQSAPPPARSRHGQYRVRIEAPDGAAVRAELASADIRGRGRYGELELDVATGDVEFDQVEGEAKVNTASGDIELRRVGSARLNSASGDVRVGEASVSVDVNPASGDVQIRKVAEGVLKVHSASGDVVVGIAKGSRLWVDAQSLSGDTSSELELEAAPAADDEGPLVELRAQTMSGDIAVRRAG